MSLAGLTRLFAQQLFGTYSSVYIFGESMRSVNFLSRFKSCAERTIGWLARPSGAQYNSRPLSLNLDFGRRVSGVAPSAAIKRLLLLLWCMTGAAGAQDFHQRADDGDRAIASDAGQDYLERLGLPLRAAIDACAETGLRGTRGETLTVIAWVGRDGTLHSARSEPASFAAQCLRQELVKARVAPPAEWNWEKSDFPLTLRVGFADAARNREGR